VLLGNSLLLRYINVLCNQVTVAKQQTCTMVNEQVERQ